MPEPGNGRAGVADRGTQLLLMGERTPEHVDVKLATLDDPALVPPQYHVRTAARLSRHRGAGPDGAGD